MPSCAAALLVLAHLVGEAVAVEHGAHLVGVEPDSDAELDQRLAVADRPALAEVRAQQALLRRVLQPVVVGEVEQPVRVERVAAAGPVEVELEAVLGGASRSCAA